MNSRIIFRIAVDLCIAVTVLQGWWFLAVPLIVIGAWFLPYFAESVIAGLAYDALFGSVAGMGVRGYAGVIVSVAILAACAGLKKVVRK